jgi:hypothetical protein|tara:strand:+ start:3201 stop:3734 length:534 start_codon:yes stop_codon:yes gene_type:complete
MIKKHKNILSLKDLKKFEEQVSENTNFSWYLKHSSVDNYPSKTTFDSFLFFNHEVLIRPEHRNGTNGVNSFLYPFMEEIFSKFMNQIKVKYKECFRININLTFNNGHTQCPLHVDHKYKHKQLLIYLNKNVDPLSCTVIKDKKYKPEYNTGILFDNVPHYHIVPKEGHRIVVVYTFI